MRRKWVLYLYSTTFQAITIIRYCTTVIVWWEWMWIIRLYECVFVCKKTTVTVRWRWEKWASTKEIDSKWGSEKGARACGWRVKEMKRLHFEMCKIPSGLYISKSYILHKTIYFYILCTIYICECGCEYEWSMHEKYKIEHVILMWTFSNDIATYNIIKYMDVRTHVWRRYFVDSFSNKFMFYCTSELNVYAHTHICQWEKDTQKIRFKDMMCTL